MRFRNKQRLNHLQIKKIYPKLEIVRCERCGELGLAKTLMGKRSVLHEVWHTATYYKGPPFTYVQTEHKDTCLIKKVVIKTGAVEMLYDESEAS